MGDSKNKAANTNLTRSYLTLAHLIFCYHGTTALPVAPINSSIRPSQARFQNTPGTEILFTYTTGANQFPLPEREGGSGHIVTDTVEICGLKSRQQILVLGDAYADIFAEMLPDGILGLGPVNASHVGAMPFYWDLYYSGQLQSPKFSWFIKPGHQVGGELTLEVWTRQNTTAPLPQSP